MDVSNSTDQNTGYRIVGAGGNTPNLPGVAYDQDRVVIRNQTFVKIDKKWYELLAEGTLEPYTYITVKPRKRPFLVEFVRTDGSKPRCNVPEVTVTTPTAQADFLISLMPNGKGAKTCACKWKKG